MFPPSPIPPKFASGRTVQVPRVVHAEGASATHSAEERSGAGDVIVSRFANVFFFCVTLVMRIETFFPETATLAAIPSPAFSGSFNWTGAAGTIVPGEVRRVAGGRQSFGADLFRACDVGLKPPMPTQNAENAGCPRCRSRRVGSTGGIRERRGGSTTRGRRRRSRPSSIVAVSTSGRRPGTPAWCRR